MGLWPWDCGRCQQPVWKMPLSLSLSLLPSRIGRRGAGRGAAARGGRPRLRVRQDAEAPLQRQRAGVIALRRAGVIALRRVGVVALRRAWRGGPGAATWRAAQSVKRRHLFKRHRPGPVAGAGVSGRGRARRLPSRRALRSPIGPASGTSGPPREHQARLGANRAAHVLDPRAVGLRAAAAPPRARRAARLARRARPERLPRRRRRVLPTRYGRLSRRGSSSRGYGACAPRTKGLPCAQRGARAGRRARGLGPPGRAAAPPPPARGVGGGAASAQGRLAAGATAHLARFRGRARMQRVASSGFARLRGASRSFMRTASSSKGFSEHVEYTCHRRARPPPPPVTNNVHIALSERQACPSLTMFI